MRTVYTSQPCSHLGLSAIKAESAPPFWYRDSVQLSLLLQGAWDKVSNEWVEKVLKAVESGDISKVKKLLKQHNLGDELADALGIKPEAIISNMLGKAETFWKVHAAESGVKRFKGFLARFREQMAALQDAQVKAFARAFPDRILHPEIERQLAHLQAIEIPDATVISSLTKRLKEIVKSEEYWNQLTDVQVARLWHAQGVKYARENGILTGRITGPLDAKTCPVCAHLIGKRVDIDRAIAKYDRDMWIEDPEKYVQAWKFPRLEDVDNMSREAVEAKGYLPLFHPHCRHWVAWLSHKKLLPLKRAA